MAKGICIHVVTCSSEAMPDRNWAKLLVLHSRQPGAHVRLMVIMEMVKEFTSGEAFIIQPYKVPLWLYQNFIR